MNQNEHRIDIRAAVSRHRALAILRLLARDELRGRTNDAVLFSLLDEWALGGTRDIVRSQLRQLEELQLLTVEVVDNRMVAALTPRGNEVANGTASAEGVEPYGPDQLY